MFRILLAAAAATVAVGFAAADDTMLKVKVGDPFPDVAVGGTQLDKVKKDATTVSVKDLKGKIAVIAFYPKALTGG
jgi:hypothetical protein